MFQEARNVIRYFFCSENINIFYPAKILIGQLFYTTSIQIRLVYYTAKTTIRNIRQKHMQKYENLLN